MIKKICKYLPILVQFILIQRALPLNLEKEIELKGEWSFEIGDNLDFARADYNDSKWDKIKVPGTWENEGFPGYDGYAWYRITVTIPKQLKNRVLYLKLGQIDDIDRTYFNGNFIGGKGEFPPKYQTAYNVNRIYQLPSNFVKFGKKNILAVRVFDDHGGGGIVYGDVGIYSRQDILDMEIDLSGAWLFKKGDECVWAEDQIDEKEWKPVSVPSYWEEQGFLKHDGYAWYRKSVKISKSLSKEKLILMLGKINDIDQTFLNGVKIGETGEFPKNKDSEVNTHKDEERAYFIPPHLLKPNKENIIAVRVFDMGKNGGIYSGYIGLASRENYLKYIKKKKKSD